MTKKDRTEGTSGKSQRDSKRSEQDAAKATEEQQRQAAKQSREAEEQERREAKDKQHQLDEEEHQREKQEREEAKQREKQEREAEKPEEQAEMPLSPGTGETGTQPGAEQEEGETPTPEDQDPDSQPMPTARAARQPDETDPNAEPASTPQTPRTAQTFAQADQPENVPLRLGADGRSQPQLSEPGRYDPRALSGEESKQTEIAADAKPLDRPSGQASGALQEATGVREDEPHRERQDGERGKKENDDPYEGQSKFKP